MPKKNNNNNNWFCLVSPNTETLHITGNSTSGATPFPAGALAPGDTPHLPLAAGEGQTVLPARVSGSTSLCHFLTPGSESRFQSAAFGL